MYRKDAAARGGRQRAACAAAASNRSAMIRDPDTLAALIDNVARFVRERLL
jgi:hypothetical protein